MHRFLQITPSNGTLIGSKGTKFGGDTTFTSEITSYQVQAIE